MTPPPVPGILIPMKRLIRNGRILDPKSRRDEIGDLLIEDGRITAVGRTLDPGGAEILDASGKWVLPGLVDIHIHLRVPGGEAKETIRTGTLAAAAGGVTSVLSMANTTPTLDTPDMIRRFLDKCREEAVVNVYTVGAVSMGLRGEELTDLEGLIEAGASALSDDGKPIMNTQLMRETLERARDLNVPVVCHEEDAFLSRGASMNESAVARRLGHKGMPPEAETVMIARDSILAEMTGGHAHFQHVSAAKSVRAIREAKQHGAPVTGEAAPHHFTLSDAVIANWGANAKMNPPLRSEEDVKAILAGLADGTLDVIATDHAPHTSEEKRKPFAEAPFGIVGLETLVPLVMTALIRNRGFDPLDVFGRLTWRPAEIIHISKGTLAVGADADIAIIDPEAEVEIDASRFRTKGRNTPFDRSHLFGQTVTTFVGGKVVYPDGEIVGAET